VLGLFVGGRCLVWPSSFVGKECMWPGTFMAGLDSSC